MAKRISVVSREAEIEEVMRTTNLLRLEAAVIVARRRGEDVADIIGADGPLTADQRQRLGLGQSLEAFLPSDAAKPIGAR